MVVPAQELLLVGEGVESLGHIQRSDGWNITGEEALTSQWVNRMQAVVWLLARE